MPNANMAQLTEAQRRKREPIFSGVLKYFPDALTEVARVSLTGNEQHNPGEPLHWAKEKSSDEDDALLRHMKDVASGQKLDGDGMRHRAKIAWRALAGLQREIDAEQAEQRAYEAKAKDAQCAQKALENPRKMYMSSPSDWGER
jgi:hypothetical protein